MLRFYFITYTPSASDNESFTSINTEGRSHYENVLQTLQEVSEYFIFSKEHPTSNIHYHGAGKVKDSVSYKDSDWLANKLRPFFPKSTSVKAATRISWIKPKGISSVELQSEITMAYCQKEDKNAFKFNISPELQAELDRINTEVPERDPVTYEFAKSERDYFCRVMRRIRELPTAAHQRLVFVQLAGDPRFTIWKIMQNDPVIYMGNFNRIADGIRQQMIKERIGVSGYEIEWRHGEPDQMAL